MTTHAALRDGLASERCLELAAMSARELGAVFLRGESPDLEDLVGWEFRGLNTPSWAKLLRIEKFIKGFFRRGGEVYGYNTPVRQNRLSEPWLCRPSASRPRRFGYYRVGPVDPTSHDNAHLHALLLDYGRGGNRPWDPTRQIRDYLVQVDRENRDLYLGKAYIALGPLRVPTNFFLLERHRHYT